MTHQEIAEMLVDLQIRLLNRLRNNIERQHHDRPVEDLTDEENGFDNGLWRAASELDKMVLELKAKPQGKGGAG